MGGDALIPFPSPRERDDHVFGRQARFACLVGTFWSSAACEAYGSFTQSLLHLSRTSHAMPLVCSRALQARANKKKCGHSALNAGPHP